MEQATLGEIKEYLKEKGIELKVDRRPSTNTLGNPLTEKCFSYYVEHSVEIEEWRANRQKEKVTTEPSLGPKM